MKYCMSCRTRKERSHFAPNHRLCADCRAEKAEERRQQLVDWRRQHGASKQRQWRARNPDYDQRYYQANREKKIAHATVTRAVRLGKLPRASTYTCVECGQPAHEYHHESYERSRWLDVKPVCRLCHRQMHARKQAGKENA